MPSLSAYCLTWVSLTLDLECLFTAAPTKHSRCSLPWTWGNSCQPLPQLWMWSSSSRPLLHCHSHRTSAHGDCSHEIKRHLLLGRKVMTNLDSILKSRDITLPTKLHLVSYGFPVVMYGWESWTIKKAKHQRTDFKELLSKEALLNCGVGEDS